jgi:gamma-glutamylcyclotransferase (GGCT)/AIG2-like uncharacterized protein YtfP
MSSAPTAIFVYGTLKRGQERERCWPRRPIAVELATVCGAIFDLGPYPALVEGDDTVAGELWQFAPDDMPATLAALDQVEEFAGKPDDLYRRVIVHCQKAEGAASAWTYLLARKSLLRSARRIAPDANGVCVWPHYSTS